MLGARLLIISIETIYFTLFPTLFASFRIVKLISTYVFHLCRIRIRSTGLRIRIQQSYTDPDGSGSATLLSGYLQNLENILT
jgi:hypothetical protein